MPEPRSQAQALFFVQIINVPTGRAKKATKNISSIFLYMKVTISGTYGNNRQAFMISFKKRGFLKFKP